MDLTLLGAAAILAATVVAGCGAPVLRTDAPFHATGHPPATSCAGAPASDSVTYALPDVAEGPVFRGYDVPLHPHIDIEGRVIFRVLVGLVVNTDGRVDSSSVSVLERNYAAPAPTEPRERSFDFFALRFARGLRFWPGCRDHGPVRVRLAYPVTYQFCTAGTCVFKGRAAP